MIIYYKQIKRLLTLFQSGGFPITRVIRALLVVIGLNLIFGCLFYLAEHQVQPELTLADAIWWGIVTMTTVGYGDFYAQTVWGRFVISYACMLIGIGLIGYVIGFFAEYILDIISRTKRGLMKIVDENHLLICNYPGEHKVIKVVNEIRSIPEYKKVSIILITENLPEIPDSLKALKIQFVQGNPTDEDILYKANILKCAGVFILANQASESDPDERSFAVGTIIELIESEHGVPIKTIVEVEHQKNLRLIKRSSVNSMISNDGITSRLLAHEFNYPGIYDIIQQLLDSDEGSQFHIQPTKLVGQRVVDIQMEIIKHPTRMQVVGIIQNGRKILNPSKEQKIEAGDQLILLADHISDFKDIEDALLNR